jgi:TAP-like protein
VADAARVREALLESLTAPAAEADYDNGLDAYYGNQCADTQYPRMFPAWLAIDRYARAGSRFGPYWWWGNAGCARWPVNDDRYVGPWTARTSAPVLVVGNYFDGVTDYAGAVASDRMLRNSRLLSYAGWGHTAYGSSECVTEYVDRYLLTVSLPPRGKVCPANPNPFLAAAARQSQPAAPLVGLPPAWLTRP